LLAARLKAALHVRCAPYAATQQRSDPGATFIFQFTHGFLFNSAWPIQKVQFARYDRVKIGRAWEARPLQDCVSMNTLQFHEPVIDLMHGDTRENIDDEIKTRTRRTLAACVARECVTLE
jgi:hypothetical protein